MYSFLARSSILIAFSQAMGTIALFVDSGVALYQLVWFFMSAPVPVASIEAEETLEKSLEETARTDQAAQ